MPPVLESLPRGARILVLRLRSLGDCVLTTPALQILKAARPDLRIVVAVEQRFAPVFEGNPDVEAIVSPQSGPVRRWRPQLTLNLHGGTRSVWLAVLSGARVRAGFEHFPFAMAYNCRIPKAQQVLGVERKVHTAEHLASAVFYLGARLAEIPRARLFVTSELPRLSKQYAMIHPFASAPDKTWSAAGFLRMAEYIQDSHGLEPVFLGSSSDDFRPFHGFRTLEGIPLADLKSWLAGSSVFLGNDSGPAHMAAAFGVPAVVIFGSSDPVIWAPWRTASEVLTANPVGSLEISQVTAALDRVRVAA